MDKKKRDCAYWIAVLLAGVALGTVIGFAFAWAWHERPGALKDVRILDVLIAAGTIGSAIGAFYAARVALLLSRAQEVKKMRKDFLVFKMQLPKIISEASVLQMHLVSVEYNFELALKEGRLSYKACEEVVDVLKMAWDWLSDERFLVLHELGMRESKKHRDLLDEVGAMWLDFQFRWKRYAFGATGMSSDVVGFIEINVSGLSRIYSKLNKFQEELKDLNKRGFLFEG